MKDLLNRVGLAPKPS